MDNLQIKNIARQIRQKVESIAEDYADQLSAYEDIIVQLDKTRQRASEFENESFIVLVVGPVKSGKSTLVNLIANSYVSPTHFLECTVRPSIVSRVETIEDQSITVYQTADKAKSVQQIDAVIDLLRGLNNEAGIEGVTTETFALNEENIERYVALKLLEANGDDTLITSIKTPGGLLLKENVFLIDMPGFDGAYANLDNPVYDAIAQRADLIVFVQSSNSAISKVSTDFLTLLRQHNQNVPVCLIHNVFEAGYWRSEKAKAQIVEDQKSFAVKEIRARGFVVDEQYAYSINLGMVDDNRTGNFVQHKERLQNEAEAFAVIEQKMYDLIIEQRETIRIKTGINRTRQQKELLQDLVEEKIAELQRLYQLNRSKKETFEALKKSDLVLTDQVQLDLDKIKQHVQTVFYNANHAVSPTMDGARVVERSYPTAEARKIVQSFCDDCIEVVKSEYQTALQRIEKLADDIEVMNWKSEINRVVSDYGAKTAVVSVEWPEEPTLPEIEMPTNVKELVPHQLLWFNHSSSRVQGYLLHLYEELMGIPSQTGGVMPAYLEHELFPKMQQQIQILKEQKKALIVQAYNDYIEQKKNEILSIAGDDELLIHDIQLLSELKTSLERFNIPLQQ